MDVICCSGAPILVLLASFVFCRGLSFVSVTTTAQFSGIFFANKSRFDSLRLRARLDPEVLRDQHHSSLRFESRFLNQVEETVSRVLDRHDESIDILELPPSEREALGVARNLDRRLTALDRNGDCRRCWLQRAHCVCCRCPSLETVSNERAIPKVRRLFLLMHHKEICLAVDTAKMILAAFPETCRLVVAGIGTDYQDSMKELEEAASGRHCLVLFPTENAQTFSVLEESLSDSEAAMPSDEWDVIVIDGTWAQAQKLYNRYIPSEQKGGPSRVCLGDKVVGKLSGADGDGRQLRRHPVKWREISTLEATRLLLGDMHTGAFDSPWNTLEDYQKTVNSAAQRQLGPPRR